MWTGRLRYFGFGFLLLALVGALLLTWLLFNTIVFGVVASTLALIVVMSGIAWDGLRQTTPENLAARGLNPDDDTLQIIEPGLRREFSAILPSAVRRGPTVSRGRVRVRSVTPPGRSRLPGGRPDRRDQDRPDQTGSKAE